MFKLIVANRRFFKQMIIEVDDHSLLLGLWSEKECEEVAKELERVAKILRER
jgi:hypothetical protein